MEISEGWAEVVSCGSLIKDPIAKVGGLKERKGVGKKCSNMY